MEGLRKPESELAAFGSAHPEIDLPPCSVEGNWHAFIPDGHGGGAEAHGRTEDELLAKLRAEVDS